MKRIRLFEFTDLTWFPDFIRDSGTDFLGFILNLTNFYKPATRLIEDAIQKTSHRQIVDLCSGNGGPIERVQKEIDPQLNITFVLSDKYPNREAYADLKDKSDGKIDFNHTPVDVLKSDVATKGFRTMFSAIHHFEPKEVQAILGHAISDNQPIGLFDSGDKHIGIIMSILLLHPILFFFCTPFIRPFKISRLVFTYIIPLIPLYMTWDGIVSIIRLYQPHELLDIAKVIDEKSEYSWSFGKEKNNFGFSVAYLIGLPK